MADKSALRTNRLSAECKPVTVNSGTTTHLSGAGMSIEQMVPYEAWTDLYIVPPLPSKEQFSIRTLSMESQNVCFKNITSDTCVQITKATTNTTFIFGTDPVAVSSSSRVGVVQYESVNDRRNGREAIMVVIPGIKNYLNTFIFAIPDIPNTDPYVACIVPSSEANGILLDGSSVSFDTTGSVATSLGNYTVLMKTITPGYHEMKHSNPQVRFGALAYGFNEENSYAFPLGFTYTKQVNVGPWSSWTNCAVKYTGLQSRTRFCENETKLLNGEICSGMEVEERQCYARTCPVDGNFNDWSVWSSCSHTCGPGHKVRRRYCNNPEPLHGGAECMGETTETQSCKEQSCPVVPYGYECDRVQDKCNGSHATCEEGICRCFPGYYFNGDRCMSKEDLCGVQRLDNVIIIVGVIMAVIIVVLAAYAVYVTILLRRKTPDKGVSSHQREENLNEAKKGFDSNTAVAVDRSDAKGTVAAATEQQYSSLYSDLKDKSEAYDVIVKN
ncbi:uncharacterized protein LOC123551768 [Mercenaria mercenaria]|uniref:uncharacterized protein LOC123551768 n=1 Tax=Mercenaria mercenaria TaxID=6596 RepID=UPI00234ED780|nr:uncharacterized protein LOC123551768 [Mercenaria mercenaria]